MQEQIITGIVSGLAVALVIWVTKLVRNKRDTDRITDFLARSKETTGFSFRSTHAIASATHISEERVRTLCGNCKRIKRNEKERESWRLLP